MNQTLVMFGWNKIRCLSRVTAALDNCRGFDRWPATAFVDAGGDANVAGHLRGWSKCASVEVRKEHMGCSANISLGLQQVFDRGAERIIVIEDDVLVATDAIEWLEARLADQHDDPKVQSVGLWRHPEGWLPGSGEMPQGELQAFKAVPGFHCWGWATWRDRWDPFFRKALFPIRGDTGEDSWDNRLNVYSDAHGLRVTLPNISRAQNIGDENWTHIGATILPFWTGEKHE